MYDIQYGFVLFSISLAWKLLTVGQKTDIIPEMFYIRELKAIAPRRPISSPKRNKLVTFIMRSLFSCFRSTQTQGYKFLVMPNRSKYETAFWMASLASLSAFTIWLILYVYIPILSQPTVTIEMPFYRSVRRMPFPAIAFCSLNRISRAALMNYSEFMWVYPYEWLMNALQMSIIS